MATQRLLAMRADFVRRWIFTGWREFVRKHD